MAKDTQREKRRVILRAAITVFARAGYHSSRVADVAKEAGVAYGLVYHYFGSKEDLLETIFRRTWTRMLQAVEAVESEGAPAREQLAAVARIVLGAWETDPELVRVLVREVARSPHLAHEVDEIEHAFAALILYGALEEILTGWVFGRLYAGPEDVERAVQTVVAVVADGLAAD